MYFLKSNTVAGAIWLLWTMTAPSASFATPVQGLNEPDTNANTLEAVQPETEFSPVRLP